MTSPSEEPLVVNDTTVDPATIQSARIVSGGRDTRPLIAGLAALLLAVLVPTAAVGAGVDFLTVAPVAAGLFLATPVGLALWLRSGERLLVVETDERTLREPVTDEERAERIVKEYRRQ
ncbi:hypothetical protein [Halosegnis sp.]|uniref:hypothetical protein n=1 Tax=Halosegnis sp. TaxID=2864959 RepID=UPI0035D3E2AC